jgi:hypothetical protein
VGDRVPNVETLGYGRGSLRERKTLKLPGEAPGRICYMLPLPSIGVLGVGGSRASRMRTAGPPRNYEEARGEGGQEGLGH